MKPIYYNVISCCGSFCFVFLTLGPAQAWQVYNLSVILIMVLHFILELGQSARGHHSYKPLTLCGIQHRHGRFVISVTTHGGLDNGSSSLHIGTGKQSVRGHHSYSSLTLCGVQHRHSYQPLTLGGVQHRHGRFVIFL